MASQPTPSPESLQAQLAELNARARSYNAQLWQEPFAYIGLVGVGLTQVLQQGPRLLSIAFFASGILGTAVLIHMTALVEGAKRAVENIKAVENLLGLPVSAKHRPVWHFGPFIVTTLLATLLFFGAAVSLWCQAVAQPGR